MSTEIYDEIFDFKVVAALDFGTTYSGYAYSFEEDPDAIFFPQTWYAGEGNLASMKTPTCLLLNPDRSLNSFGYMAENKYVQLASEDKHRDYYLFLRFKMNLHWKDMSFDHEIPDVAGKRVPALHVFALSIHYLKEHLLQTLHERGASLEISQIKFVLSVPAIWTESAKRFMREAAVRAGIHTNQLILALEPEAASICCQRVPNEHLSFGSSEMIRSPGVQYLVADVGGGTADFSVHEVNEDGSLTEIHMATGGASAGTNVDEEYLGLFQKEFGEKTMLKLIKRDMEEFLGILRSFEIKKRLVCEEFNETVNVSLAPVLLNRARKKARKIKKLLKKANLKHLISFSDNKIKFSPILIKSLFRSSINGIIDHILSLLEKHPEIEHILLVGGFSESRLLQEELKKRIPNKIVVIPNDSGLSVLKGAVHYGHNPLTITARIMKFTYGVASDSIFEVGKHPTNRKYQDENGEARCKGAFRILIAKGTKVSASGLEVSRVTEPIAAVQTEVSDRIYYTDSEQQVVVDEKCQLLKGYTHVLPKYSGNPRLVSSSYTFGLTEIRYRSEVVETGEKKQEALDLM